jgi:hypothetical protein
MDGTDYKSDWHKTTQNDEYLQLCVERLDKPILKWVNQIATMLPKEPFSINEIGCNVGHFYRVIQGKNINYKGYDVSKTYLDIATQKFGEYFYELDITKQVPQTADITIISATLEHLENFEDALKNIFLSTNKRVIIRTFVGWRNKTNFYSKSGLSQSYIVRQFTIKKLNPHKIPIRIFKDDATNSKIYKIGSFKRRIKIIDFNLSEIYGQ